MQEQPYPPNPEALVLSRHWILTLSSTVRSLQTRRTLLQKAALQNCRLHAVQPRACLECMQLLTSVKVAGFSGYPFLQGSKTSISCADKQTNKKKEQGDSGI